MIEAIIAVVGSLLVALLGYNQWKRQPRRDAQSASADRVRVAHEELWAKLEEIHLKLRRVMSDDVNNPEIFRLLQEANDFMHARSLYFKPEIIPLVGAYLDALNEWRAAVYTEGSEHVMSRFYASCAIDEASERIDTPQRKVNVLRSELLAQIRGAAGIRL